MTMGIAFVLSEVYDYVVEHPRYRACRAILSEAYDYLLKHPEYHACLALVSFYIGLEGGLPVALQIFSELSFILFSQCSLFVPLLSQLSVWLWHFVALNVPKEG